MFIVKYINASMSTMKIRKKLQNEIISNMVISPIVTRSPFNIPDSPKYISICNIKKMTNIYLLRKLEYQYDEFLEKKCQILLLLNTIDEVLEIRDALTMRIIVLKREKRLQE